MFSSGFGFFVASSRVNILYSKSPNLSICKTIMVGECAETLEASFLWHLGFQQFTPKFRSLENSSKKRKMSRFFRKTCNELGRAFTKQSVLGIQRHGTRRPQEWMRPSETTKLNTWKTKPEHHEQPRSKVPGHVFCFLFTNKNYSLGNI